MALTPEQRREVGRLLGVDWEISGKSVTLRALGVVLAKHGLTVARFAELLHGGPIPVRRELTVAQQQAAQRERRRVSEILAAVGVAEEITAVWLAGSKAPRPGSGRAEELVGRIAEVWPLLPWHGPAKRLGQLAAEATGPAVVFGVPSGPSLRPTGL